MIKFERFKLDNGLTVLFHKDPTTPLAVVNTLYDVGARDEVEEKTGFAHLFEHLMFGGSVNIPDFDAPLQIIADTEVIETGAADYYALIERSVVCQLNFSNNSVNIVVSSSLS